MQKSRCLYKKALLLLAVTLCTGYGYAQTITEASTDNSAEQTISKRLFSFPNALPKKTIELKWVLTEKGEVVLKSNSLLVRDLDDVEYYKNIEERSEKQKNGCFGLALLDTLDAIGNDDEVVVEIIPLQYVAQHPTPEERKRLTKFANDAEFVVQKVKSVNQIMKELLIDKSKIKLLYENPNDIDRIICAINKSTLNRLKHDPDIACVNLYCKPNELSYGDEIKKTNGSDPFEWSRIAWGAPVMPTYARGKGINCATNEKGIRQSFFDWLIQFQQTDPQYHQILNTTNIQINNAGTETDHTQMTLWCMFATAPEATIYHHITAAHYDNIRPWITANNIQTISQSTTEGGSLAYIDDIAYNSVSPLFCSPTGNGNGKDTYNQEVSKTNWNQYNGISVGGCTNTNSEYNEIVYDQQYINPPAYQYRNPIGDREMPHIVSQSMTSGATASLASLPNPAPLTQDGAKICGTSAAAPTVNGVAACVISANPSQLVNNPEATKVALMLTAEKTDPGYWDQKVDERDGCGAINGYNAAAFAHDANYITTNNSAVNTGLAKGIILHTTTIGTTLKFNVLTPTVFPAGKHLRAVLTWTSNPNNTLTENKLSDLNLFFRRQSDNKIIKACASFDDNVEVIDLLQNELQPNRAYTLEVTLAKLNVPVSPTAGYFKYAIGWTWVKDFGGKTITNRVVTGVEKLKLNNQKVVIGPNVSYLTGSNTTLWVNNTIQIVPEVSIKGEFNAKPVELIGRWIVISRADQTGNNRNWKSSGVGFLNFLGRFKLPNGAWQFRSASDRPYVQISNNTASEPSFDEYPEFSISLFVKVPNPIVDGTIYSALDPGTEKGGFAIDIKNGQFTYYIGQTNSTSTPSSTISAVMPNELTAWGRWVHIGITWSGPRKLQQLFINGKLSSQSTTTFSNYYTKGVIHYIGKRPTSGNYFNGSGSMADGTDARVDEDIRMFKGLVDADRFWMIINHFGTWPTFPGF